MKRYVLAITGASGPIVGIRVLGELLRHAEVHLVLSSHAQEILKLESAIDITAPTTAGVEAKLREHFSSDRVILWDNNNLAASISSGSFDVEGMIVAPCSMKTLAGIACGYAENLVQRVADVQIKEGRPLVLSPREMPLSAIHLENMLKLSRLGVRIAPPIAAFYQNPASLDDMVNFFAGKLLDALGVEHSLYKRWDGSV